MPRLTAQLLISCGLRRELELLEKLTDLCFRSGAVAMFFRLIVFKVVFFILVAGSAIGLAIREGANESRNGADHQTAAARAFRRYPLPLGCACALVASLVAFGDLLMAGRRKGALPTYTDEEFLAKFGGSPDSQRTVS